jgi:hypothetical protein
MYNDKQGGYSSIYFGGNVLKKEQHHQKHEKEREHQKKEDKKYEQQQGKNPLCAKDSVPYPETT